MRQQVLPYPDIMKESAGTRERLAGSYRDLVIMLHGIMRTPRSMGKIQRELVRHGYDVLNFGYPSTSQPIEIIVAMLSAKIEGLPENRDRTIHFVTHSLGSIVARYYLTRYRHRVTGRFVMIAPPNHGSFMASLLNRWPAYRWFFGVAGQQLLRIPESLPNRLGIPACEFGIIAGGLGNETGFNPFIPGDNDMTVAVEETRLDGMKDFVLVKTQHSLLLYNSQVIQNIISFLDTGSFIHNNGETSAANAGLSDAKKTGPERAG